MSDHTSEQTEEQRGDNFADACAAIAILTLVVGTSVFWLAGMPSSLVSECEACAD